MWIRSRIASGISSATSTRTRRFFSLITVSFVLVVIWQNYHPLRTVSRASSNSCLDVALYQFIAAERRGETSIHRVSPLVRMSAAAVLGNGNLGIDLYEESLLFSVKGLQWVVAKYSPQLSIALNSRLLSPSALVFEYKEATFHYIYADTTESGCVQIRHSVHVHRNLASLLVQELFVHNGAPAPVQIQLKQSALSAWAGAVSTRQNLAVNVKTAISDQYIQTTGSVPATAKTPEIHAAVASVAVPVNPINVGEKKELAAQFLTVVEFQIGSNLTAAPQRPLPQAANLGPKALADLQQHLMVKDEKALLARRLKHVARWAELWKTMPRVLSVSHPSTPGNAEIFASLFYILATTPDSVDVPSHAGVDVVMQPDKECFTGPPTMHTTSLWLVPPRLSSVNSFILNWHRTLSHGACDMHLNRGVGLLGQVITLSFLGLRHVPQGHYLDLALNPALVQADALVHNMYYAGHSISLNIQMEGGAARKMLVKADPLENDRLAATPLFACPASCSGKPLQLSLTEVALAVIATKPVTPLLYFSSHLEQLSTLQNRSKELQTYHLPGETHHHEWGVHTVSPRVWLFLGLLLTSFHVFLIYIVSKEYCPDACNVACMVRLFPKRLLEIFGCIRAAD